MTAHRPNQQQDEKFKQAARDLECDPDEARWEDRLRKVVKQKPKDEARSESV
jgi:hypothetical protein